MKSSLPVVVILFLLSITLCPAFGQSGREKMKMLNYNVLHGFNNDSTLMDRFVDWVRKIDPDIIAYQELNGFNQDSLEELALRYGHRYAVINSGVTHPIGLSSKYPIVMVQNVTTNMWHSYLYGIINDTHIFVTHLSPFEVELRRADIDRILAHAKLLPPSDKIIIAGDFNALAAKDSVHYGEKLLTAMKKSEGRLEPKSGLPIVKGKTIYRNNLNNGKLDFTVTDKMLMAGFADAFYLKNQAFKHSAPTEAYRTKNSFLRRIDFVWVNKTLASQIVKADIIHDEVTKNLSDHYPVFISW